MTMPGTSTAEFFEAKYKERADPWDFANSRYEVSRYEAIIAALDHRRYQKAFEPGCSVGVLTERLAMLSDKVVAIDFSQAAVAQAQARCSHCSGVEVYCATLLEVIPKGGFDLIVLSEIGYYFSPEEWAAISSRIVDAMDKGATLLAAHWIGRSDDHQMSGDAVHEILGTNIQLALEHSERHPSFRMDRWVRA